MFGIMFEGHPNLVPILLPEDMLDHFPLRKDRYVAIAESPSESRINQWRGEGKSDRDAPGISGLLEALNAPDGCTVVLFTQREVNSYRDGS
jgi:hypothetical protein